MDFTFQAYEGEASAFSGDALVLVFSQGSGEHAALVAAWPEALSRALAHVAECGDFSEKPGRIPCLYPALMDWRHDAPWQAKRILVAGLDDGKEESGGAPRDDDALFEALRLCGGRIARRLLDMKAVEALVLCPPDLGVPPADAARELALGLSLGGYVFAGYKKDKDEKAGKEDKKDKKDAGDAGKTCRCFLALDGAAAEDLAPALAEAEIVAKAVLMARDMGNEPANRCAPADFAARGERLGKRKKLKADVLDKGDLKKQGLNAVLAVSAGSAQPPTLSVLEYRPAKKNPTVLLVGKGLTFDSGGICAKPPAGLDEMKLDMCGGAAVFAVMRALAELGLPGVNVVGLVPASENLSGSAALKPGDVVQHCGGIHAEITNTDAEGRLILADALAWGIAKYKPDAVIDIATLTGAAIVGLGHHYSALLSNDDGLAERILAAGRATGEPFWRLPLGPEYRKQLESKVADIKNAPSDRSGGTIVAACYLKEFVGDTPWAHLDIAGTAWNFTKKSYVPKGASGVGARAILKALADWGR